MAIADCLRGVISQRLVRKVCNLSREELEPDDEARRFLHIDEHDHDTRIVRGIPTDANFNTGYSGRTAVFESMLVSHDIQNAISNDTAAYEIQQVARSGGMMSLEDATRRKVFDRITSVDELRRVMCDTQLG